MDVFQGNEVIAEMKKQEIFSNLFKNCTFYLGREVPSVRLLFLFFSTFYSYKKTVREESFFFFFYFLISIQYDEYDYNKNNELWWKCFYIIGIISINNIIGIISIRYKKLWWKCFY
jgi:hypothetical protein